MAVVWALSLGRFVCPSFAPRAASLLAPRSPPSPRRSAIPGARLVCVPYQILFSKEARKALGIDLKGCTVIVDEAHNIPEAIRGMASSKIDLEKVERAERAVNAYVERYETRLKGKNLEYCMQIKRFVQCLAVFLRKLPVGESSLLGLNEFMFGIQCDNINLCKVDRYIVRADLNKKLLGFITAAAGGKDKRGDARDDSQAFVSKHISPLRPIHDLIKRLSGSELDGKVVVTSPKPGAGAGGASPPSVRYFMLNPSTPFAEVVGEAQAVILAGGTLRPFSHICSELLPAEGLEAASLADSRDYETPVTEGESSTFFSCDHVVPRENVHCISLSHGPDGNLLEFNYANRQKEETLDSLGRSITNLCNVVPAGVVVFLPSYAYEAEVVRRWKDTGAWEMIKSKKRVFREPKDAKDLDATLSNYSRAVAKENGAVLFSVVGGKMSEGINFADDMARCVVVVGLPFPDSKDPELKEKMQHLDKEYKAAGNKGITGQVRANGATSDELRATSDERRATSDERRATSGERRASSGRIARAARQATSERIARSARRATSGKIARSELRAGRSARLARAYPVVRSPSPRLKRYLSAPLLSLYASLTTA